MQPTIYMQHISEAYGDIEEFKRQAESTKDYKILEEILAYLSYQMTQVREKIDALMLEAEESIKRKDDEAAKEIQDQIEKLNEIIGSQENPGIAQYGAIIYTEALKRWAESTEDREALEQFLEELSDQKKQIKEEINTLVLSSVGADYKTAREIEKKIDKLNETLGVSGIPGIAQHEVIIRDAIVDLKFGKYKKLYRKLKEMKEKARSFKQEFKELTERIKTNIPEIDLDTFQTLIVDPLENISINEDFFLEKNIEEIDNTINSICESFIQYFSDESIRDAFLKTLTEQLTTKIKEQKKDIAALNVYPSQMSTRIALLFRELLGMLEDKVSEEDEIKPGLISQGLVSKETGDRVKAAWELSDDLLKSINEVKREKEKIEAELAKKTINEIFDNHDLSNVFETATLYRSQPLETLDKEKARQEIEKMIITGSSKNIEDTLEKWGFTLGAEKIGEKIKQNYYYSQFYISQLGEIIKKAANGKPLKAKAGFFTKLKSNEKSSTILFIKRINEAFRNRDIPTIKENLKALGFEEEALSQATTEIDEIMPLSSEDIIQPVFDEDELTRDKDRFGPTCELAKACKELRDYRIAFDTQLSEELKNYSITDNPYSYAQDPKLKHRDTLNLLLKELLKSEKPFEDIDVIKGFNYKDLAKDTVDSYNQTIRSLTEGLIKYLNDENLVKAIEETGYYYNLLKNADPSSPTSLLIKSLNFYPDLLNKIKDGAYKFGEDNPSYLRRNRLRSVIYPENLENLELAISLANQRADELATQKLFGYKNKEIATYLINNGCLIDRARQLSDKEASKIVSEITKVITNKQSKEIAAVLEKHGFFKEDLEQEDRQEIAAHIKNDFYLDKLSIMVRKKIKETLEDEQKIHAQTGSTVKINATLHGEKSTTIYLINKLNTDINTFNDAALKGDQKKQEGILQKITKDLKNLGISNKSGEIIDIIKQNAPKTSVKSTTYTKTKQKESTPSSTTSIPIPTGRTIEL